jgi:ADP-heptose:LPS heptosyltransferase
MGGSDVDFGAVPSVCMFSRLIRPGMGDLVQRNIFLSMIKGVFPNAKLSWIVGGCVTQVPFQEELVRSHSYADEVVVCPDAEEPDEAAWRDFRVDLADRRFAACVVDPSSVDLGVQEAWDAGIGIRVALPIGVPSDRLITHPMRPARPVLGHADLYDYATALGQALGIDPMPRPAEVVPRLPFRPEQLPPPPRRPFVGLHPGGAKGWNRRWPMPYFADLAERLVAEADPALLIVGSPDEHDEASVLRARILERCPEAAVDLSVGEPLNRLANQLDRMDLLVGNDSGPAHLAAALSTPTVVIYGPTGTEPMWVRVYPMHRGVNKHSPCQQRRNEPNEQVGQCEHGCPCYYVSPDGPYPKCMLEIAPDEVWPAVAAQLQRSAAGSVD